MGSGIATAFARYGHHVLLFDSDPKRMTEVPMMVGAILKELADTDRFPADQASTVLGRLKAASELAELAGCTLVIEAIPERLE